MGSHYRVLPVRGFAHGSPAVIESSTPMGSPASRCGIGWWELSRRMGYPPRRDAIHRVSPARGAAPPRHSSPRWAIRSVRDAMNRVSTQRASCFAACIPHIRPPTPRNRTANAAWGPPRDGAMADFRLIHEMFPRFHGMFRSIHGVFPRFHGVFPRFHGVFPTDPWPALCDGCGCFSRRLPSLLRKMRGNAALAPFLRGALAG